MAADRLKAEAQRRRQLLAFGVLMLLAALFLAPRTLLENLQQTQQQLAAAELGRSAVGAISRPATAVVQALAHAVDLQAWSVDQHGFLAERSETFFLGLYAVLWRLVYFGYALLLSVWLLVAAFSDGLGRRRLSQWRYEYPSPMRHFLSRNVAMRTIEVAMLLAVLPIPLPPILLVPWLVVLAIALRTWAANLQQRM